MITRLFGDRQRLAVLRRIDRPAAVLLAIAPGARRGRRLVRRAALAGGGHRRPAGARRAGGRARHRPRARGLGLARYAIPATAGIAATLFGRLIPGGLSLLLVPIVAVMLWSITYLELRAGRGTGGRTLGDLVLTAIVFTGAAGCSTSSAPQHGRRRRCSSASSPAARFRAAEARGTMGAEAFGQALLQVLAVVQVGIGAVLLERQSW